MLKTKTEKFNIGGRAVGNGEKVFMVAEVANAHNGNFETALKMIDAIKETGVDSVKFQLHIVEDEMIPSHPKYKTQGERALSIDQIRQLKTYVEKVGLIFLCSPFSRKAIDALAEMNVDAFKIGSGEMSDPDFIDYVARKGRPIILSTGMSELSEIEEAVAVIRKHNTPFMLVHCISMYPPSYDSLNLNVIPLLKQKFGVPVGLSDHTAEIYSAIASVPLGASLIEKHYTLDRSQSGTSDHKVSLEPREWQMLVDAVRKVETSLGDERKIFDEEKKVIEWARHSIVSVCAISAGKKITRDDLSTKRPLFSGIPAKRLGEVVGKVARKDIPANVSLTLDDVAW